MKELNDKDFDQAFKTRVTEEYLEFEEESWLKMEKKLQKRDRMIWLRNASIVLLFLSFGLGFYLMNQKDAPKTDLVGKKPKQEQRGSDTVQIQQPALKEQAPSIEMAEEKSNALDKPLPLFRQQAPTGTSNKAIIQPDNINKVVPNTVIANRNGPAQPNLAPGNPIPNNPAPVNPVQINPVQKTETNNQQLIAQSSSQEKLIDSVNNSIKKPKIRRKTPISLAISAGPDFNSTSSLVGGKGAAAFGLTVGIGLTKKLAIQTGLIYGAKNYSASNYDYHFNNPNVQASIAQINAACKVLEIPLRASYSLSDNKSRSIELNGGLSSYLMLKENYVFKYTAASGKKDRITEKTNANQHFLSVLDLSATYNIKLNSKLGFGVEPYVKIPLSGIGEGNVPLKSSGVSLKLRYDFNKK